MLSDNSFKQELLRLRNRVIAEISLYEFLKQAWPYIEGANTPFVGGKHIEAICEHLEALVRRDIRHLLINIPFRCSKSSIVSVAFPAWRWIACPPEQFMYASYSLGISMRDSTRCRRVIDSPWYQANWGNKFALRKDQNTKGKFDNNKGGYRIATSVGASATGYGANILVIDDGNNAAHGEVHRQTARDWYSTVWSTRLNDRNNDCTLTIMQRLNEGDLAGYILDRDVEGEVTHLMLPMEFEESRRCSTIVLPSTKGKVWTDWRIKEGQLLWPEKIDAAALAEIKSLLSEYDKAGQLQQRPAPEEGGIIKKGWFQRWKSEHPPEIEFILQSWDTGVSDLPTAAYSACTTWGVFQDENGIGNVILLEMWRGRVGYPELREKAYRLFRDYRDKGEEKRPNRDAPSIDMCLIEAKATGDPLIRDLRRMGITAIAFDPKKIGDKERRVNSITHLLEAGVVWLPARPKRFDTLLPFAGEFLEEVCTFPNSTSRDLVDTMTQALAKLRDMGLIYHPRDERDWSNEPVTIKKIY